MKLSDYPSIQTAIKRDGAIRVIDGRWSDGFVSEKKLKECIEKGLLVIECQGGMQFAVPPQSKGE